MRIAYICADRGVPVFGQKGASIHVQEVIRALRGRGARVELFATRLGGDPPPDLANLSVHQLPAVPRDDFESREPLALAANHGLDKALKRAGHFDLVYERYSLWSFAGMEYARVIGVPGFLEVNSPLIDEQARHRGLVDRAGAECVARRVFNTATALLAVSDEVAEYLNGFLAAPGCIHVVPNGVNPQRFPPGCKPVYPALPGVFTIGFVGKVRPWHGLPALIEAFTIVRRHEHRSRLLIVGEVPGLPDLIADLALRGLLAAVVLTGPVDPSLVPGMLASMDVAVAPYASESNFYFSPLKVYEYMAAGLPVVASRVGQLAQLIEDNANGLLCPPGDPFALAAALARLKREPELRLRLGQAARTTVIQHHTWDAIARRILGIAGLEPSFDPRPRETTP
jgi:glycosyltransferase involved in cell wall biosynthesis